MKNQIVISAFSSETGSNYILHFANGKSEQVSKSDVEFLETAKGKFEFGEGIQSRYFAMSSEIYSKLQGKNFYSVM